MLQKFQLTLVLKLHDLFWHTNDTCEGLKSKKTINSKICITTGGVVLE